MGTVQPVEVELLSLLSSAADCVAATTEWCCRLCGCHYCVVLQIL